MEKFSVELEGSLLGCSMDDAALVANLLELFVQQWIFGKESVSSCFYTESTFSPVVMVQAKTRTDYFIRHWFWDNCLF